MKDSIGGMASRTAVEGLYFRTAISVELKQVMSQNDKGKNVWYVIFQSFLSASTVG